MMKNLRYNNICLRTLTILCVMMVSVGAWATDYVFVYNGNYLGVNAAGTGIENYTTFIPERCVWTCMNGNNEATLGGTSYALRITYNGNTRYLTSSNTNGATPTLATTAQNVWRANGTNILYRNGLNSYYFYYRNGWKTSATGRANNNNGYLSNNGNTDYRATLTASSIIDATDGTTAPTISYGSRTATTITLNRSNIGGTYTPAATTIVVGGTTYYKGTNGVYSTTAPSATLNPTYTWSATSGNASITQAGVVTPNNNITNNITVRLTTTNANPAITKTTDYTINVSSTAAATTYSDGLNAVNPVNNSITYSTNTIVNLDSPARKKNTTAAYQTYTASGNTFYRVNNNFQPAAPTPTSTDVAVTSYSWALSGAGATYAQLTSATGATNTLIYNSAAASDVTVTINVTANYAEGGNISKTADVTLKEHHEDPTAVSASDMSLNVGENKTITPTVTPADAYKRFEFSSANTGIATVNATTGEVTGVAGGQTTVTIKAYKYSAPTQFVSTTITVTVMEKVATPVIEFTPQGEGETASTTITCGTAGASIYYTTDGSTPTTGSTLYTGAFNVNNLDEVKAIAVKSGGYFEDSEVTSATYSTHKVASPTIIVTSGGILFECEEEGEIVFYYTTNGSTPTTGSTRWNGTPFTPATDCTIKVIATKVGCQNSDVTEYELVKGLTGNGTQADPYLISNALQLNAFANQINNGGAGAWYKVTDVITGATGYTAPTTAFSGNFDGGYFAIDGLTQPLFERTNGATIKNVILDNVNISGARTVNSVACLGAIACYAEGSTKIYNCGVQASGSTFDEKGNPVNSSSTISGGDNTGSLVGYITGNTRVVNNYSYANVSGGQRAAGIVGRVAGTALTNANRADGNHCAVVCNMFYGDLSGTSYVSPVYAGNHTSNVQNVNEYNYWRSRANVTYNNYNNQLAIDKNEFLNRFPFYRHILNTHRELAAIYLFGSRTDANVAEIGHWYNTKNKPNGLGGIDNPTPYPIIEVWKTNTKRTTEDIKNNLPNTGNEYEGNLITAADRSGKTVGSNGYLRVNWTVHGKSGSIDLPITDMDSLNYDFTWGKVVLPFATELAEKNTYAQICTGWKITGITGGTTGTLANYDFANRDCTAKDLYTNSGYIFAQGGNYIVPYGVTAITIEGNMATAYYLRDGSYDIGYDANYANATAVAGNITGQYHGQNVYTDLNTLLNAMGTATDPHQQAIVLVGNYHYNQNTIGGNRFGNYTTKGLTIMSVDEDNNQEPDYGWYSYHTTDRTDIAPVRFDFVPNIGIGMAARTTGSTPYPTIGIWHGHGWFELTETCVSFMSECEINSYSFNANDNGKGNNRWIANSGYFIQIVRARDGDCTKLSYIQIGGNAYVEQLYPGSHTDQARSVTIRPIIVNGGEIEECYMTGYKAGATATGQNIYFWSAGGKMHKWLGAYAENPNTAGVNVTAKIDHAIIGRFFGGGTSTSALIKGNIDITMNNSFVNFYCGGPEFGDMGNGKTVTTHANGTIFGEYYGGGFGGTSITINREAQTSGVNFGTDKEFDLAFTNYTSHRLQNGTYGIGVNYDFEYILYSGGGGTGVSRFYTGYANYSLAQTGNVTNVLENCTVLRDYFGGGCQGKVSGTVTSTLTNCDVMGSAFGGGYKPAETTVDVYPTTQPTYSRYTKETGLFSDFGTVAPETYTWVQRATSGADAGRKELYTTVNMSESGRVTGAISITVNGGTIGQNVYGGGNESPSDDAATVLIKGGAQVGQDAFGGGNIAPVGKDVSITLGVAGVADASNVSGAIYGGGALANTNTTSGNTTVNLYGGSVTDVYGGGLGRLASGTEGQPGYLEAVAAIVNGNTTVTLDGSIIRGNIFGCNNLNGTPKGHAFVDIKTTTAKGTETPEHPYHVPGVYGGGNLAAYVPTNANDKTEVLIEKCDNSIEDVFGGGNAAAVPETDVTVWGGQIGRVFAGGNGSSAPADVTRNTKVTIHGGTIKEVYGGSNSQGTIGGTITVDVAELKKPENPALCPINVTDLYGGGNMADSKAGQISIGKCTNIDNVYGGANKANVAGNITLDITDGHIGNVFGGNNNSGQVNGNITVNVNWVDAGADASLGNVYGGGNLASIDNGTPREVTVNIIDATTTGSVFGAGKGKSAVLVGNTIVNIGSWTEGSVHIAGDVFGGGDLAAVEGNCTVTIRDCATYIGGDLYGGGNAAPVFETNTTVWGGTIAGNLFGGGNGVNLDPVTGNPKGAQVGYARDDTATGGSGNANTYLYGGTIGVWNGSTCESGGGVFGGSNSNGNIRGNVNLNVDERKCGETGASQCDLKIREIYGAGNEAAYAGTGIDFNLGCVSFLGEIYGGAKAADLDADAILTITSGTFGKVFGGNNVSGKLNGTITVTIDETGCHPVIIDELYGGGNLAAYSVYGYEDDGTPKTSGTAKADPQVNIISCTEIGTVFGGGYGETAVMVGNPSVNINQIPGLFANQIDADGNGEADNNANLLGAINTVFGGGNAAKVIGTTTVNVGTLAQNAHLTTPSSLVNAGANITGNVYGGGNQADVTGKTNVTVGQ